MRQTLEAVLKETIGLDAASIGHSAVERALQARLRACHETDVQAYIELVRSSAAELQQLIEAIIVPETWFFRDRGAFALLADWATDRRSSSTHPEPLRLLSLPCSTGEEPYSMAMALLDAGIPADGFCVDAIDISVNSLALARRAVYGRNSFRNAQATFRDRYFSAAEVGWQLGDAVRRQVQFRQDNLFAADFLPGAGLYDVIFCRNVLIYFDRAGQDRAIQILRRLLPPTGLLFVAPSETNVISEHGFVSAKIPMAFAFRKDIAPASMPKPAMVATTSPVLSPHVAAVVRSDAEAVVEPAHESTLEQAVALANAGHKAEAARLCDLHIKTSGPSAPAYNLIALIRAGGGNAVSAIANYRKSLYLDPNNYEALTHLAFLLQKRGDVPGANTLRARARRIQSDQNREKPT